MAPAMSKLSLPSQLPSSLSSPVVQRNLGLLAAIILGGSFVLPSLLPARFTLLGWPRLLWDGLFLFGGGGGGRRVGARDDNKNQRALHKKDKAFEKWLESEREYAWRRLLKNIAPPGTDPGCVVASPSKKDPNYWFQWTRDSAMVFKVVIEYYARGKAVEGTEATERLILDYVAETKKMQMKETPSGGFRTGGLGEVKFHTDGNPYEGSWGRPQFDGPALRASALIKFATLLLDRQPTRWESYVREELYDSLPAGQTVSIIKADLDFVVECWKERCFDLWEEVSAVHHFNYMVYIRALHDGAAFARRLGDTASADIYSKTLMEIQSDLERFWDEEKGYLLASINVKNDHGKVRWLDTGTVLGFLHAGDLGSGLSDSTSSNEQDGDYIGSDKSLVTQHHIATSMRDEYRLNDRYYPVSRGHLGYAIGRYYEDVYDGDGKKKPGYGNPWYLCTMAHAEFYYRLVHHFANRAIVINKTNKPFYMELGYFTSPEEDEILSYAEQTYEAQSKEHQDILAAFVRKGDAFMSVVKDWARWNGGLWEQFDRNTGEKLGAPHLTWSYAAFLSAVEARNGKPMFD